jgi:outer membrane protein assembly factor BamA
MIPGDAPDNLPPDQLSGIELQDSQNPQQQSSQDAHAEAHSDEKSDDNKEKGSKRKKDHTGAIVAVPLPIVSPALGAGLVPVVGYITPIPTKDKKLAPSVIGAGGLITNNGTRGFALGTDLYLQQARYELESMYAHGNLNYNLYGVGFDNGNAGLKLPLEQSGQVFFVKFLRNIGWDTYVGGRFLSGSSSITLRPASGKLPPLPPDLGIHTDLRSLGVEVWRDSRPNRFYPLKGSVIDFTGDFFAHDLGSKYSFQSYKFTFDKYVSLTKQQVLAYNLNLCGVGGSPPFYANCIYGAGNELRGYTAGRYLDRYMVATQVEYRLVLPWGFGLVGFGGIGGVAPGADQFRTNHMLPGVGTGIRYMLSKKYHVNLRTDFAWGKDNFTWSVGVGEAF